jgi:hypothetical protein
MGMGKFTIRYGQIYEYITGASANTSAGESTNPDPEVLSDTTFRAQSYLQLQIYDYITGASATTSAGESTDPDLGAMKLYKHLCMGKFTITGMGKSTATKLEAAYR